MPPARRKGFAFPLQTPKRQIGISLLDAFVSKIANQKGPRSTQKSALTRGHPRKCQRVRPTLIAYGVRINP